MNKYKYLKKAVTIVITIILIVQQSVFTMNVMSSEFSQPHSISPKACFESRFCDRVNSGARYDDLSLNAISAVLIDGQNNRILYAKNPFEKRAMASTTKIMTCVIALEYCDLNDVVYVSKYASSMPNVKMGLKSNEKYKLKDLLYGLMLESYNDVAVAIAEHISGDIEKFAVLMNKKAKNIGMKDTNFVTPNGLDANNHHSTSYDMALLGAYAIRNNVFRKIVNCPDYVITELKTKRTTHAYNKDLFLKKMNNAIGIKTGFTGKAGYCFVGATDENDRVFVSAVLGAGWPPNKNYKWIDTLSLMKYGMSNYKKNKILDHKYKNKIKVINGVYEWVDIECNTDYECLIAGFDDIKTKIKYKDTVKAPVYAGDIVGKYCLYVNDEIVYEKNIVILKDVPKKNIFFCIKKICDYYLVNI
ncbi:MAG: D-alanyl-D-alanine carboxypeptidase [Lachnospiraceae bacterium]|nr:D-alanyl-D-alanine carboxypeptidase [Lachnospiraceae bacterium]